MRVHRDTELSGDETSSPGSINNLALTERLRLIRTSEDTFIGNPLDGFDQRVYGGHLLGQALLAASATVKPVEQIPISLHCHFLTFGRAAMPIRYHVAHNRDGRSFSARSVQAYQDDLLLMSFQALFNRDPPRPNEPVGISAPAVPDPEQLAPLHIRRRDASLTPDGLKYPPRAQWWTGSRPFDIRVIDGHGPGRQFWFRTPPESTSNRHTMRAVLACASDRALVSTIISSRAEHAFERFKTASLDHAMWFHQDAAIGEWLLYVQHSAFSSDVTGLAHGMIFNQSGELVASVMQQGLFTPAHIPMP